MNDSNHCCNEECNHSSEFDEDDFELTEEDLEMMEDLLPELYLLGEIEDDHAEIRSIDDLD